MNIQIIKTDDGSDTIYVPEIDETYHSKFGAINEAKHVFIENGLAKLKKLEITAGSTIKLLEIGFGTGLNTLLTLLYSQINKLNIRYITVEKYPLSKEIISSLNYSKAVPEAENYFNKIHEIEWEESHQLSEYFILRKLKADILDDNLSLPLNIDLIYFDAFAPSKQVELWNEKLFKRLSHSLNENGKLVTYSAAGIVKQALRNVGFNVKRLHGPTGKHHMLFCSK